MVRRPMGWWLLPAGAFVATLAGDGLFVATRSLDWWRFSQGALLVGVVSGFTGLLVLGVLSRGSHLDRSAESKLDTASVVLAIAALANYAFSLGLRAIADPTSSFAWLALYLTAMASLLLLAAGGVAWRRHRLHAERSLRVTMATERERARR